MTARLVCAAVLLSGRLGVAQKLDATGNGSAPIPGPLVSVHGSTGKLDPGEGNTQAVARETADALAGQIEEPIMTPTRSSFLAKWSGVAGATGYRLDVSTSPSFDSYVTGYWDRDIGRVTSHIVSGLERGTQ